MSGEADAASIGMEALAGGAEAAPEEAADIGEEAAEEFAEAQEEEREAPEPKKKEAPKPPEKRKYKLKLKGAEEDWEGTDEDIQRELQKARYATKRHEEASEKEAKIRALFEHATKDPAALLEHLGIKPAEWARAQMRAEIQAQMEAEEDEALGPEAKELKALKRQLAEREKAETESKSKAEEEAKTQRLKATQDRFEKDVMDVLESAETMLPKDEESALLVLEEIEAHVRRGEPYEMKDLVARVQQRELSKVQRFVQRLGPAKARKALGDDVWRSFKDAERADAAKQNPMAASRPQVRAGAAVRREPEAKKAKTEAELRKEFGNLDLRGWKDLIR